MNQKFYAVANRGAEIEFNLTAGQKYVLEFSQKNCGTAAVYDLSGNFLKYAQTDDFNSYEPID